MRVKLWDEKQVIQMRQGLASEAIVNGRKYIAITVNAEGNHNTEPFHVNDAFYLYNQLQSQ